MARLAPFVRACDEIRRGMLFGDALDQIASPKLPTNFDRITTPVRRLDPSVWGEDVMAEVERIYGEME